VHRINILSFLVFYSFTVSICAVGDESVNLTVVIIGGDRSLI